MNINFILQSYFGIYNLSKELHIFYLFYIVLFYTFNLAIGNY